MSEIFPEHIPSPLGPDGPPAAMVEEARRAHALELAVRIHCARVERRNPALGNAFLDGETLETADRFANYLRGGSDG